MVDVSMEDIFAQQERERQTRERLKSLEAELEAKIKKKASELERALGDALLDQRIKELEQVVRQLVAHNNLILEPHVVDRLRLRMLTENAEEVLRDDRTPKADGGRSSGTDGNLHGKEKQANDTIKT